MTEGILHAVFLVALGLGMKAHGEERALWLGAAVVWRIGFGSLLRPGEMARLAREDVNLPGDMLEASTLAVLVIHSPKNRRHFGRRQFTVSEDAGELAWLIWWCQAMGRGGIFPGNLVKLRSLFKVVLKVLGVEDLGFTLASLRTGGATRHFRRHQNIGRLQYLGRWKNASTLQHYLQEAMAMHVEARLSDPSREMIAYLLKEQAHVLSCPPPLPAQTLLGRGGLRAWRRLKLKKGSRQTPPRLLPRG